LVRFVLILVLIILALGNWFREVRGHFPGKSDFCFFLFYLDAGTATCDAGCCVVEKIAGVRWTAPAGGVLVLYVLTHVFPGEVGSQARDLGFIVSY
jgi:hypothetical protein